MTITIKRDDLYKRVVDQNIAHRYKSRRRVSNSIHVSDLLSCLRKSYYGRKMPEIDDTTTESHINFLKGEGSERIMSEVLKVPLGIEQATIEMDGILAHPDILKRNSNSSSNDDKDKDDKDNNDNNKDDNDGFIVELKDSVGWKRLKPSLTEDIVFSQYVRQVLYYMVMTSIEKGLLVVKYNESELEFIQRSDAGDLYLKRFDGKKPEIEVFEIKMSNDDHMMRDVIKQEMLDKKDLLLKALETNQVKILPRLQGKAKILSCKRCPFYSQCYDTDTETIDAITLGAQKDPLVANQGYLNVTKEVTKKG
jgi:hypothetical protein